MAGVKSYARLWPLAIAAVGVAGIVYAAFRMQDGGEQAGDGLGPEQPVGSAGPNEHFEKVRPHKVDELSTYRGKVRAGSAIDVRAPRGMRVPVVKIHHEAGDFVKKGDVLVTLDRTQIDKAIEKAKAEGRTDDERRFRGYLEFVEIKAPCDGVVGEIQRTLGETPIDDGIGLVTVQNKDAFCFVVRVPVDVQQLSMPLGTSFDVVLEGDLGTVKGAVIDFEKPEGTDVPVVLQLEPHEGIEDRLEGTVRVASGRVEVGLVPKTAVTKRGDVPIVRVWDPATRAVGERTVKLGEEIGPDVVILAGAFEGDSVVVPGPERSQ
jgi:multidrug efflux pump subunit AcrA (membrane-fusion protein)